MMDRRTSRAVIEELLPLQNSTVIDVGCGNGVLARTMARKGAHVTGIEVSPRQLAKARAEPPVADERYLQGVAEDVPLRSRSADIVVFFNSFHHVDPAGMADAMREAVRVLKPGGILYVSEPLAEGPYFEVMRPAHDETKVRRAALDALRHAADFHLIQEQAFTHVDSVKFKSFEAFRDRITSINPETRERFAEREDDIRANFERLGTRTDKGWAFDQPMRVMLFRRV